jgi:hypothetical protein
MGRTKKWESADIACYPDGSSESRRLVARRLAPVVSAEQGRLALWTRWILFPLWVFLESSSAGDGGRVINARLGSVRLQVKVGQGAWISQWPQQCGNEDQTRGQDIGPWRRRFAAFKFAAGEEGRK